MTVHPLKLSRRSTLAGGGALILSFSLSRYAVLAQDAPKPGPLPGDLKKAPFLDSWIRVGADGKITVFTGKSELGQGIKTALRQVAAEELSVSFDEVDLITSDTAQTADEGFTSGSQSMSDSGTAILHAAAQVRELLIGFAATKLGVDAATLKADGGKIVATNGQSVGYGELVGGDVPACSGATAIETQRSEDLFHGRSIGRACGHSRKSDWWRGLCSGHAHARHGSCSDCCAAEPQSDDQCGRYRNDRKIARSFESSS